MVEFHTKISTMERMQPKVMHVSSTEIDLQIDEDYYQQAPDKDLVSP